MPRVDLDRWREKLRPIFFEVAHVNRSFEQSLKDIERDRDRELEELGSKPPEEQRRAVWDRAGLRGRELTAQVGAKLIEIDQRHPNVPYNAVPFRYLYTPEGEREDEVATFMRELHWWRHQESIDATRRRDSAGDLKAWGALYRTGLDFRLLAIRREPITPYKVDVVHRQMLELVMVWEKKPLTAEERTSCLDEWCGCGSKEHDTEALKKQFNRLKKDLLK
jgi:hypothetical protein